MIITAIETTTIISAAITTTTTAITETITITIATKIIDSIIKAKPPSSKMMEILLKEGRDMHIKGMSGQVSPGTDMGDKIYE